MVAKIVAVRSEYKKEKEKKVWFSKKKLYIRLTNLCILEEKKIVHEWGF